MSGSSGRVVRSCPVRPASWLVLRGGGGVASGAQPASCAWVVGVHPAVEEFAAGEGPVVCDSGYPGPAQDAQGVPCKYLRAEASVSGGVVAALRAGTSVAVGLLVVLVAA